MEINEIKILLDNVKYSQNEKAEKLKQQSQEQLFKQRYFYWGVIIFLFILFIGVFCVQANKYSTQIDVLNVTIEAKDDVIGMQETQIKQFEKSENHWKHILRGIPENMSIEEFDWSEKTMDSLVNRKKFKK
jgi:hypothetical protein